MIALEFSLGAHARNIRRHVYSVAIVVDVAIQDLIKFSHALISVLT